MDLQKVIEKEEKIKEEIFLYFTPDTQTINKDKQYLISKSLFIKRDFDKERGLREASFIKRLCEFSFFPKIVEAFDYLDCFEIKMERIYGLPIENIKNELKQDDKEIIVRQLFDIYGILRSTGVVHGDINESNLIYNVHNKCLFLIDFEFACLEDSNRDLTGPNWGIYHILSYLK